jgi:outer membrane biosynthesis protein TonB
MKATILFIALFLTTSSSFVFAGNGDNLLDRIMHRKISYPESLRSKGIETTVYVKVRVLAENQIELIEIASDSEEMKAAIEKQVQQIKIKVPQNLIGKTFNYAYKFEVQK